MLQPGGVYVFEDTEKSNWMLQDPKLPIEYSITKIFQNILYCMNSFSRTCTNDHASQIFNDETIKLISTVTFAQNCIIVLKKTLEEQFHDLINNFQN